MTTKCVPRPTEIFNKTLHKICPLASMCIGLFIETDCTPHAGGTKHAEESFSEDVWLLFKSRMTKPHCASKARLSQKEDS